MPSLHAAPLLEIRSVGVTFHKNAFWTDPRPNGGAKSAGVILTDLLPLLKHISLRRLTRFEREEPDASHNLKPEEWNRLRKGSI